MESVSESEDKPDNENDDQNSDSAPPPQDNAPPPAHDSNPPPPSFSSSSALSSSSIAKQSVPISTPNFSLSPSPAVPSSQGSTKPSSSETLRPYLGAFLLIDENTDSDVITDVNAVHSVGAFAQITSVFAAAGGEGKEGEGLTAVLYPHRRIKITELVKALLPIRSGKSDSTTGELSTPPPSPTPLAPIPEQTAFLHAHGISIVNITNLKTAPYSRDDQHIRAFMSEIVSVFKDITQLNPLFRDQIPTSQ